MSSASQLRVVVLATPDQEPTSPTRERVRAQSTGARTALDRAARRAGCPPDAVFDKDAAGAPRPTGGWCWSLSHDATWVAAAVHRAPVGVDLERIDLRRPELVERILSDAERAWIGDIDARAFTRVWTAKEAVLKAAGVGLAELSDCRVSAALEPQRVLLTHRDTRCVVQQVFLQEHVLAVHTAGEGWDVEWDLPA